MLDSRSILLATVLAALVCAPVPLDAQVERYDVAILGGRVVDPETGFDGVANVGLVGDRIAIVTSDPISGASEVDARGLVVAPGFIDPLTSVGAARLPSALYKGTDGVTTVLQLHGGPVDVDAMYQSMESEDVLLNYGTNVGHAALRGAVGLSAGDEDQREVPASPEQVERIVELARQGIMRGALGIGFGIQYVPSTSEEEVFRLFELGARYGVPLHVHIRYLGPQRPINSVKAIHEVIATAAATGASAHIAHVNSTSPKDIGLVLDLLEGAAAHGVDMSADAYPWEAGSTGLESSVFDEGFRERMSIGYGDIELVSTGARLTGPIVMVASDGAISPEGRGHPRGAGTYARFLRQYVREWGDVTLVEAMRKTSFLAAVQLQQASPAMRRKGRLSAGADADIVVFDLATVRERATYLEPAQTSVGIEHVWVNGVLVVDSGELVAGVAPGRAIRGAPQRGR